MSVDPAEAKAIFLKAVEEHTPQRWSAFLDTACKSPEVRQEVDVLLATHEQAGDFLDGGGAGVAGSLDEPTVAEHPGETIGVYRLLEQIGEGGSAWSTQPSSRSRRAAKWL